MGRRTLLLVVSILVAAIGVGLVGLYVKGADQRANTRAERIYGPRPTPTPTPKVSATLNRHDDITHLGLTVELKDADRVVGLLQPGDLVAVYTTRQIPAVLNDQGTQVKPARTEATRVVDSIKVIGVGAKHDVKAVAGEEVATTIVALDADNEQTQAILVAQVGGHLTLVILGKNPG